MKPIEFPEVNCVYAKDQPEYLPLPVHKTTDGIVISCWSLTWRERLKVIFTGRMWWSVLTFNHPLQPQLPSVHRPFTQTEDGKWWKPFVNAIGERNAFRRLLRAYRKAMRLLVEGRKG